MPQCQFPIFCYFCVSEKLHRKYSRNWMKQRPNLLFFHNMSRSPKQRRRGARTWPHPRAARARPWPCHQGVRPPGPPPDAALLPIYSPRQENLKDPDHFSMKHTASRHRRRREIGRVQKLFLAPYRRGESPPEAFVITMVTSRVMCE
jgi:hypothetical protein